ncbi:xanthine dehydrogenase family protein subunit M [Enterovirga sp.]|uniref:FAD binding domain-containing protein n=1 Tax=Enterovirga sp. TaxID=2026350 RepID=UPI002B9067A3|nr:xanthine dehydrogenase family protein subunit M [Enterovirga sp.]HMO30859.1 xanthine dehydrogenase family protein subunit M [Enterovirga sp.]
MYAFEYLKPKSLAEAAAMLAGRPESRALSGGHTLIPAMKLRLTGPSALVDLNGLDELRGIRVEGDRLLVGALSRHHQVANSEIVRQAIPTLAEMVGTIGDPAVRHRGTIGGSLANNDPSADYAAAAMALDATIVTNGRRIAADDYFQGLFSTALEEGEIITAVEFPIPRKMGYAKFRNPASRYALCAVCVAQTAAGETRVAVIGAGADGVFRARELEEALAADFSAAALEGKTVPSEDMASDIHADQDYRAHLVIVMAKRAVAAAG